MRQTIWLKQKAKTRKRARSRGSVAVEMACSSVFLVIFAIFGVYLAILVTCAQINDTACRDAARAAAEPQDATQANGAATTILSSFGTNSTFMTPPTLQTLVYQDFAGSPPADTSPFVSVTTVSDAKLPFAPMQLFGGQYGSEQFTFRQTYTFPIVNTK